MCNIVFPRVGFLFISPHMRDSGRSTVHIYSLPLSVMGGHQWPDAGLYPPQDVFHHLEHLKADFDNVLHTLEVSSSRARKFSSNLRDNIDKDTTDGIAEAEQRGQCITWSGVDKDSFTNTVVNNIVISTAADAQVTIPLAQFHNLHQSYEQLHAKLNSRSPTPARYSRLDAVGKEAAPNVAVVNDTRIVESKSYSATIIVQIVNQASVNRMEGKDSRLLGEALSLSLEAFFSNDWFRGSIRLSSATLLDSGDVEIIAHAEHRGDLERLIQTTAWHNEFERSLGPLPNQTYKIRMHNMRIGCMTFRNRKEKSAVVMTLLDSNYPVESDGHRITIRDISWCDKNHKKKKEKAVTALMIEFLFPEQANKAIAKGLYWQGKRHACNIADRRQFVLQRCLNCQNYGHLSQTCSAEPQCGDCAGQHRREDCTSTNMECVLCSGPHHSAARGCPARKQAKEAQRFFPIDPEFPATEPIAGVHVAIKREPELPETMFDRTQDGHAFPRTLLQQIDSSRIVGMARETGLPYNISVKPKREAKDDLPGVDSGGDSKRIKQEDLKQENPSHREDSMAPYRQPSPYIILRPN